MNKKIAIIGFGHIGKALMKGLINGGIKEKNILNADIDDDNRKVVSMADLIILALTPSVVGAVVEEIKDLISYKIVISVAAGVRISSIEKYASNNRQKIIRLMPNIPIAENEGVIGFFANKNVSEQEKSETTEIFSKLGKVIHCKREEDLNAITILSGSGPAVVAYLISMLSKSGEKFGFDKNMAEEIALYTFSGTLAYLQKTKQKPLELQNAVATKGGTTEAIIKNLDAQKLFSKFFVGMQKGYARVKKISDLVSN